MFNVFNDLILKAKLGKYLIHLNLMPLELVKKVFILLPTEK